MANHSEKTFATEQIPLDCETPPRQSMRIHSGRVSPPPLPDMSARLSRAPVAPVASIGGV